MSPDLQVDLCLRSWMQWYAHSWSSNRVTHMGYNMFHVPAKLLDRFMSVLCYWLLWGCLAISFVATARNVLQHLLTHMG